MRSRSSKSMTLRSKTGCCRRRPPVRVERHARLMQSSGTNGECNSRSSAVPVAGSMESMPAKPTPLVLTRQQLALTPPLYTYLTDITPVAETFVTPSEKDHKTAHLPEERGLTGLCRGGTRAIPSLRVTKERWRLVPREGSLHGGGYSLRAPGRNTKRATARARSGSTRGVGKIYWLPPPRVPPPAPPRPPPPMPPMLPSSML